MMKVEVKLYSYHDMDLVGLYKTGKVSFPETTRQVLNSYARGEVYKVKLLHTNEKRLSKYPKTSFRKYYHYHVMLDEKEDSDAIALLHRITPGYRNNFIKVVLRQYLCGVFLEEYCVNGDTSFFNEMSRKFQGGRDEKEIKQTKKEKNEYIQTEIESANKMTEESVLEKRLQTKNVSPVDEIPSADKKKKEKRATGDMSNTDKKNLVDKAGYKKDEIKVNTKIEPGDKSKHVELISEKRETVSNNMEHNTLNVPIRSEAGNAGNDIKVSTDHNKAKSHSQQPSDDTINVKPFDNEQPDHVNSIKHHYNDDAEDDFDDFLDEMTEQY